MIWGIFIILVLFTYVVIRLHDLNDWLNKKIYELDHKEEGKEDAEI